MYHCETIDPLALTDPEREAWIGLLRGASLPSPLLHPDFARLVRRARNDARVALFHDMDGRLAAVLPHHRRPDGFARPIGAAFSDIHTLLAAPDFNLDLPEVLQAAGLKAARFTALLETKGEAPLAARLPNPSLAAVLDGVTPQAFLDARRDEHPRKFKGLRRLRRKLEAEEGAVEIRLSRDVKTLDALFAWKREQFRRCGRHDVLAPDWARLMMARLFNSASDVTGCLVTFCVGGRVVAAEFGPRWEGVFHPWIAAYDPEWAKWSPGHLLVQELIGAMPRFGLTRYEIGTGHEDYKKYFASHATPLVSGFAHAPTLDGRMAALGRMLWAGAAGLGGAPVSRLATRIHGRLDHVAAAETRLSGRLAGVARAAGAMFSSPQEAA